MTPQPGFVCHGRVDITHSREFDCGCRQNVGNHPGSFSLNKAIRCDVYLKGQSTGSPLVLFLILLNGLRGMVKTWFN